LCQFGQVHLFGVETPLLIVEVVHKLRLLVCILRLLLLLWRQVEFTLGATG
jgi:hypothetical protein